MMRNPNTHIHTHDFSTFTIMCDYHVYLGEGGGKIVSNYTHLFYFIQNMVDPFPFRQSLPRCYPYVLFEFILMLSLWLHLPSMHTNTFIRFDIKWHSIILHSSYHSSTFIRTPFATISALIHSFSFTHTLSFPSLINKICESNLCPLILYLRSGFLYTTYPLFSLPTASRSYSFLYSLKPTHVWLLFAHNTHTHTRHGKTNAHHFGPKKAAPVSSQRQGKLVRAVRGCVCPWYKMAVIYWFHSITMYMYNILQFFFAEFYFLFFVFICTRFFCSFKLIVVHICTHTSLYAPILRGTQLVTQNPVALKLQNILLCKQSSRSFSFFLFGPFFLNNISKNPDDSPSFLLLFPISFSLSMPFLHCSLK